MAKTEYKKYDSSDKYRCNGARLAKDAEVRSGEHGLMVRLTFVSTSRKDAHSDMWVECNVGDFHAKAASYLKKGDILHEVEGKPCLRLYGDDNEKFSFVVDRASIVIPLELFAELKERGFDPQGEGNVPDGDKKSKGKKGGKPDKKAAKKDDKKGGKKKPAPVEIPDDEDDDLEIEDDEDADDEDEE